MTRLWPILLVLACTPSAPAKYPDHAKVSKASLAWCEMLADLDGEKLATWRHAGACKEAYPAASAAYLQRLSRCYGKAMRDYGDTAPDSGAIIDECSQKILMGAEVGNVSGTELYKARCARQARCQNVSQEVCDGAWARLDGMTQSLLSSKFNLRAQAEIASCLESEDCQEDDASVERDCYKAAHKKIVWLPLSLGHDSSLGPKTE